jgi:poly-gamma-glutamate synthesis protein (capsule biosynthesis protein)
MRSTNHHLKQFGIVGFILVVLAVAWLLVSARIDTNKETNSSANDSQATSTSQPSSSAKSGKVRLIATGDMLPHDTVNQAARTTNGYDYLPLFSKVAPFLKDADIAYCNQESPSASQFRVSGYPTFNAPISFAHDLSTLGCNMINLANNHANDRGQAGITATRQVWDALPTLAVAGTARSAAEQKQISIFRKGGITFAFLSYARCSNSHLANSYGVNILNRSLVSTQIKAARAAGAQMIIVGTHWCHENVSHQDADQDAWAAYLASQGVDIVIGTGPHWLQPVKQLPKAGGGTTLVWFSLGNFLSSQLEINGLIGGIAVMEIDVASHSVTSVGFMPTYMHYEWTATQKAQGDLLARHNLMIYPLDQAADALAQSQNHTTVSAQTTHVTELLNTYMPVEMLTSRTFTTFGQ